MGSKCSLVVTGNDQKDSGHEPRRRLAALVALCLSRAGVLGVIVSALMSGIGAVHGPVEALTAQYIP